MPQSARFWDRIAKRYARQPIADEESYEKKLQVTRQYFGPETEVLEFGCGTGSTAIAHSPYVKHIRATDISPKMIEIAITKARDANVDNVSFEVVTIEDIKVADQSFDAVLGLSILHLLEDKEAVIARIYDLLKPGGVFVTSTACLGDRMKWFRFVAPIGRFVGLIPLVRVFSAAELEESLAQAGFEIDYRWRPDKAIAVFIVAKKPDPAGPIIKGD